jgi:hypothetical protein
LRWLHAKASALAQQPVITSVDDGSCSTLLKAGLNEIFGRDASEQILLKLHGGVSVRDTILNPTERHSVANLVRNPAMIAVPGTSKASDSETDLDALWDCASEVLSKADEVSIAGYSCPASDEKAKALLLDSLHTNANRPTVDVVLGPGNPIDAQRLIALLRSVGLEVRDAGMWAQDYLSARGVGMGWQTLDCRE